jgi:hypothetical protein
LVLRSRVQKQGNNSKDAPVWFCDPWPHPFGLAGLEGFLNHFLVTIRAYDGYLDVERRP